MQSPIIDSPRRLVLWCLSIVLVCGSTATAASGVAQVLETQRRQGFVSPQLAIAELEAVRAEAGDGAPIALRAAYHSALASLYIGAEAAGRLQAELDQLSRLASQEACAACLHHRLVREVQWAVRRQDAALARDALARLDALPETTDPDLLQAEHYVRGAALDSVGEHDRAVEHGIRAVELAIEADNPAEQVRALNLLSLANVGRRDLARGEALSVEAHALAERMGFVYMMAYLRGNQAWIHALKNEPTQQYRALMDVAALVERQPGLDDVELVNLVNLAEYHVGQQAYREAIEVAERAVALAEAQDKPVAKAVVMINLGQAWLQLGRVDDGIATLRESVALLRAAQAQSYLIASVDVLATALQGAGRNREAVEALRELMALKDRSAAQERERATAEAQEKFSTERKDHEIERLSLENARRQAEVAARTWQQRLWLALAVGLALGGVLLLRMIRRTRARNRQLESSNAVLSSQSLIDPLTGAYNRRHCHALMSQREALLLGRKSRDRSYDECVGLILLDVDHFKQINDDAGHAAGDAVLVDVARRLRELLRTQDAVVRWGGEEFVLLLPGTGPSGMAVLAERMLHTIGGTPVMVAGAPVTVTVSAGCVAYPLVPGQHWEDALQIADLAMYLAKQRGRNRAICLLRLADGVHPDQIRGDLGAAEAAGQVELISIDGRATATAGSDRAAAESAPPGPGSPGSVSRAPPGPLR
jgi:diguanylate cyclase (GGDEF)-like protein